MCAPMTTDTPDTALARATEHARRIIGLDLKLAIAALRDPVTPRNDRAAYVAVLGRIRLELDRVLKPARLRLAEEMRTDGVKRLGILTLKEKPADVVWICNDPDNWTDAGIQDALDDLLDDPDRRQYVNRIPDHLELDYLAVVADMRAGSDAAASLYRAADAAGWRRKGPAKATLESDEVKLG